MRSKMWQTGKKLSTRYSESSSTGGIRGMLFITVWVMLLWLSMTPLGVPVVPEV